VLRDGKWTQIESKKLVPGDMIRVGYGDMIAADIRLIEI
jgi:magnesium-transporting ATPase (P-type)